MSETVSIIIGTYGDLDVWGPLAQRAIASAQNQTIPCQIIWNHCDTLQQARNAGGEQATGDWLVHLDADDELDPHYAEGILAGSGDLRQPKTVGVHPDGSESQPEFIPPKTDLSEGNWLVVGTAVRRDLLRSVGGWGDEALYEDWSTWIRCWNAGAEIGQAPGAIYRIHVNTEGRNLPDRDTQIEWFNRIVRHFRRRAAA